MDRYDNILVSAAERYLNDLQYLAKDNTKSLNNMLNLYIVNSISKWAQSFDDACNYQKQLDSIKNCLVNNDDLMSFFIADSYVDDEGVHYERNRGSNVAYKHVNISQPYEFSSRMYDEQCKTINKI